MTQETEALFVVGRAWCVQHTNQKLTRGPVYTLNADGSVDAQWAETAEQQVIYLEGPDEDCADWLQQARDLRPELGRHTGWFFSSNFFSLASRRACYCIARWEDAAETAARAAQHPDQHPTHSPHFIGPLQEIREIFLRWRAGLPPERRAPVPPGAEWKPLFDQEGLIQCEEGELCIFAVSVSTNGASPTWEYFIDSVVWDAETEPEFRGDQSGWGLNSGLLFVPVSKTLPALPPIPTHSEEEGGTS